MDHFYFLDYYKVVAIITIQKSIKIISYKLFVMAIGGI